MYEDALDLLSGSLDCWVAFSEKVYLPYEQQYEQAIGVYHWIADVHIFRVPSYPYLIIICPGPVDAGQWSFYTLDTDLGHLVIEAQQYVIDSYKSINKMDA